MTKKTAEHVVALLALLGLTFLISNLTAPAPDPFSVGITALGQFVVAVVAFYVGVYVSRPK